MSDKCRFSSPLTECARELRREQTIAEKHAWYLLRDRRTIGLKFRRQVAIDDFIVDFYCDELKLIIEIDGDVHDRDTQKRRNEARDKRLKKLGYKILRFSNALVINDPDVLIQAVRQLVTLTLPSPRGRGL